MEFLRNRKNLYFTGLYLSFFAFIVCSAAEWHIGAALFRSSAVCLFGLFLFNGKSAYDKENKAGFEKLAMALVVLLFNMFMMQRAKMAGHYEALNNVCGWVLIFMCVLYTARGFSTEFKGRVIGLKEWAVKNRMILLVILCFVLLSAEVIDSYIMWDAWAYYNSLIYVAKCFNADLSGIYDIYLCGHASLGYSLWLVLFQMFNEGAASAHIADIVLAAVSVFSFYQILRKLLLKKYSDKIIALAAALYAFSPFVLGMVGNLNPDSATMYFAVIFIACSMYNYECLELILAFCFCFTKETAVIYYVVYILAKVLCEYFSENGFHLWKLIKFGFGNIKNYIYAVPAIVWLALIKMGAGGWASGTFNSIESLAAVISVKLKQIFLLNFSWIFVAVIVLGITLLLIRRIKQKTKAGKEIPDNKNRKKNPPVFAAAIVIIALGCLHIIWTHVRYIIPMIFSSLETKKTGYNYFGIDESVISMKLKQTFLLNFNWIFWIVIVLGAIMLLIQKIKKKTKADKEILEKIIPVIVVIIVITAIGCLYITWTHVRYITPMIPLMYLLAVVIAANIKIKGLYFGICNAALAFLLLIQCFVTIDPVMRKVFPSIPIGSNKSVYSMQLDGSERISDSKEFHDSIVYNRQYIYWQEALTELFNEAGFDENMLLAVPSDRYCTRYEILGTGVFSSSDKIIWNKKKGRFDYYNDNTASSEYCILVNYCNAENVKSAWESSNGNRILYIIPAWSDSTEIAAFEGGGFSKEIIKDGEIAKKGYNIKYSVMDVKYNASILGGSYTVSPKQDSSLGLGTDGTWIWLKDAGDKINLSVEKTGYKIKFNDYQTVMDVQYNKAGENGTVWLYEDNGTSAQRWHLEEADGCYMICWGGYALTYDLGDNSVRLAPKTGGDNQLWSFAQ